MKQGAIRIVQRRLRKSGHYNGPINGRLNARFDQAVADQIDARLGETKTAWSMARKRVAALQLVCADLTLDPGPIDGLWGTRTETAYADARTFFETGALPLNYRDLSPRDVNPNDWPCDSRDQAELIDYFDFDPAKGGQPAVKSIPVPWTLKLDWNRSVKTRKIGCHPKLAPSLERVLEKIAQRYGPAERSDMGLDIYGGCLNVRRKRGGSTWSAHSFAAAIDFDPSRNKLRWGWQQARLARRDCLDFWQFWEEEGWVSLGRSRNFDWMHLQAIKLP
ncbi:MAG: hypothetical protein AB8B47_10780 [Roseobacter sp.]